MEKDYPLGVMGKELFALSALLDSMSRDYANQEDDVSRFMLQESYRRLAAFPIYLKQKKEVPPLAAKHQFMVDTTQDETIAKTIASLCERAENDPFLLREDFETAYQAIHDYCIQEISHFLMPLDNLFTKKEDQALEKVFSSIGYYLIPALPEWER